MPHYDEQTRRTLEEQAERAYVKERKPLTQVGEEMGRHEATVRSYLANAFVPRRRRGAPEREDVETSEIVRLRELNMSWAAIAKQVGMSKTGCYNRWHAATKGHRPGRDVPQYSRESQPDRLAS